MTTTKKPVKTGPDYKMLFELQRALILDCYNEPAPLSAAERKAKLADSTSVTRGLKLPSATAWAFHAGKVQEVTFSAVTDSLGRSLKGDSAAPLYGAQIDAMLAMRNHIAREAAQNLRKLDDQIAKQMPPYALNGTVKLTKAALTQSKRHVASNGPVINAADALGETAPAGRISPVAADITDAFEPTASTETGEASP